MDPLRSAYRLLETCLGGRVELDAQGPAGARLPLRFGSGEGAVSASLVRWREGTEATAGERVVWVLDGAPRALRQRFREEGRSFVDLGGAVRLELPGMLVDRTDLAPVRAEEDVPVRRADPFADRASLVPRLLLETPGRAWGVRELAGVAGTGLGSTSRVVQALERLGLAEVRREGRASRVAVPRPMALLRRWAAAYDWTRNAALAFHAPVGSAERFLPRLPAALEGRRWALTLHAGASLLAPHAAWERVHLYVEARQARELAAIGRAAGWSPAREGRVVLMQPFHRTSAWHGVRDVGGLPVVSPLQLVLDLWHHPLRGREQAEHLVRTALEWEGNLPDVPISSG